jgi:hypothetical protein
MTAKKTTKTETAKKAAKGYFWCLLPWTTSEARGRSYLRLFVRPRLMEEARLPQLFGLFDSVHESPAMKRTSAPFACTTDCSSFLAYPAAFKGGVRVASADVNSDGLPDIITALGPGTVALVKVFSGTFPPGQTPPLLYQFKRYVPVGVLRNAQLWRSSHGPGYCLRPRASMFIMP